MARPTRRVPKDSSRRRVWVYVAVAVFVLGDIVLVGLALNSTRSESSAADTVAVVKSVESSTPSATPTPAPIPTVTAGTDISPVPPTRILTALDGSTAWRATTGPCPATLAAPERTTDSGATWKSTDATGSTRVTALQRITVTSQSTATLIGLATTDCAPQLVKTFVGGDAYKSYPDDLVKAWYVNPANRAAVHSPTGETTAPCDAVIVLAPRDAKNAAVLCATGRLYATTDAAVTWSAPVDAPGVLNITATGAGYLAVAAGRPDCAGIQLLTLSAKLAPTPTGCAPTATPVETLSGNVAVSVAADTVWLWAGESLLSSSDNGATWN
jgi:hypothetical protein